MKYKRAILFAVIIYALSLVLGVLFSSVFKVDVTTEVTNKAWLIGIVSSLIVVGLLTWVYFKKVEAGWKEGLYFGLIVIGVGFLFDAAIFIPYLIFSSSTENPFLYYTNYLFWLTVVLVVAETTILGWLKKKK